MDRAAEWLAAAWRLERRSSSRIAVALELEYTVPGCSRAGSAGWGQTIDLSGSGLGFTTDREFEIGQELEVFIRWPVWRDGKAETQLVLVGEVVRSDETVTAIRIRRRQFRTLSPATQRMDSPDDDAAPVDPGAGRFRA